MRFLLGGYTADMDGHATGIGMLLTGDADDGSAGSAPAFAGDVVTTTGSPSWVALHPGRPSLHPGSPSLHPGSPSLSRGDVVYAALEGAGTVQAFRRTGEASFAPLGAPVPAGDSVCHIAVDPAGTMLVASCWGDGRVVTMALDAAGRPSAPVVAADPVDPYAGGQAGGPAGTGSGSAPGALGIDLSGPVDLAAAARALREAAGDEYAHLVPDHDAPTPAPAAEAAASAPAERVPHAHQARFLPGGWVVTTDMGFDVVRFWRADAARLRHSHDVVLPQGSGPRHTVWHPSGHLYVVAELSCEVFALAPDAEGRWRIVGGSLLGAATLPGDTAAEIALSHDREFVYAGVRGSNTLAALRVRGQGDAFAQVALVDAGVNWPRHHVIERDILLVAGQLGDEVASITLDVRTGVPGRVRHRVEAPSPTCLVPLR